MPLAPGTRLGVYDITAPIGEGGMGAVYRARDTKLDRNVAIKILPEAFAHDAERLARFNREAKTLASLNHPNIAGIYGFEEVASDVGSGLSRTIHALVMELVEGDDLSQRIARGAIPIDEALPLAKQIAAALEAAHEQGIIHRDLKPANIKVRRDGMVKVLDFGLAKALTPVGAGATADVSMSPTITTPAMTQAGMILGTAAYMSPEQARGKAVDKRADIWAFGVVLYEMVTGRRAFNGEDMTEVLGAVVRLEPDWDRLPVDVPPAIRALLESCLTKDPRQRVADISTAIFVLDKGASLAAPTGKVPAVSAATRGRLVSVAALAVAVVIVALAIPALQHLRETAIAPSETRVDIVTPATDSPSSFALSPDGRHIAFVASGDGASRLWLRSLATTATQPLMGTEGATAPFWAPDGHAIGFFAGSAMKRLELGGGAPQTLAPIVSGRGTWSADGVIVFTPNSYGPLMRISADGGAVTAVTTLGPQQTGHFAPHFLPDGKRFLFSVSGAPDAAGIYLGALDASAPTRLTAASSAGVSLPSGWLLWVRGETRTLVAQRLDVAKAALTGESVSVADGVIGVSVAATGLMAYRTDGSSQRQLTWMDQSGTATGTVGVPGGSFLNPRVTPDGERIALTRTVQGNTDIWLLDGARTSRFTFDTAPDLAHVWSPDGTRIAFNSSRTGQFDLYQKLTSGAGVEERLLASDQTKVPTSWSADGRFLLYYSIDPQTNHDIWTMPIVGDHTPSVFLKTPFAERHGAFSPNGRWVAYESNESGRNEIYVRPFIPPSAGSPAGTAGGQWQVSTAGGIMPVWRADGRALHYLSPAGAMMAAPVSVTGATFDSGAPLALFPTRIFGGGEDTQQGRQFDVAPDGRFLINTELDTAAAPITLVQNWQPATK